MKDIYRKYKAIILYLLFGVLTTGVNVVVYWFAVHICMLQTLIGTVIAWIMAVLFAYITNRRWVFESKAYERKAIIQEVVSFFLCRLATGIMDLGFMILFVNYMHLNDVVIKLVSNVLVIVLNYIASKLIIFHKNGK